MESIQEFSLLIFRWGGHPNSQAFKECHGIVEGGEAIAW